uniref:Uncharacterized protein n=1 Tax=Gluconobacter oxydans TaxID=442 RepID=A0A0M4TNS7_GLUOY|nr:hypothetical protein [Gluconobacter oxydans]
MPTTHGLSKGVLLPCYQKASRSRSHLSCDWVAASLRPNCLSGADDVHALKGMDVEERDAVIVSQADHQVAPREGGPGDTLHGRTVSASVEAVDHRVAKAGPKVQVRRCRVRQVGPKTGAVVCGDVHSPGAGRDRNAAFVAQRDLVRSVAACIGQAPAGRLAADIGFLRIADRLAGVDGHGAGATIERVEPSGDGRHIHVRSVHMNLVVTKRVDGRLLAVSAKIQRGVAAGIEEVGRTCDLKRRMCVALIVDRVQLSCRALSGDVGLVGTVVLATRDIGIGRRRIGLRSHDQVCRTGGLNFRQRSGENRRTGTRSPGVFHRAMVPGGVVHDCRSGILPGENVRIAGIAKDQKVVDTVRVVDGFRCTGSSFIADHGDRRGRGVARADDHILGLAVTHAVESKGVGPEPGRACIDGDVGLRRSGRCLPGNRRHQGRCLAGAVQEILDVPARRHRFGRCAFDRLATRPVVGFTGRSAAIVIGLFDPAKVVICLGRIAGIHADDAVIGGHLRPGRRDALRLVCAPRAPLRGLVECFVLIAR